MVTPYGHRLPMVGLLCVMKSGCARGRGRHGRGNGKGSFHPARKTGKVFSSEMPFYSKF